MKSKKYLRSAMLEVVHNQICDKDPPETKQTYERLIKEGYSKKDTEKYIACVVSSEIFDVLKNNEAYNRERFVKALKNLPIFAFAQAGIECVGKFY